MVSDTEELVACLSLTGMDLSATQEPLAAARELYAAGEYTDAAAQAECASTVALRLNERFDAYMDAWNHVQACMAQLQGCGLPTDELEAALDAANREIAQGIEEDGMTVPNYTAATASLEEAWESAHRLVDYARIAVREIRLASISVEALSEPRAAAVNTSLALHLERIIEQATRELALGHVDAAHKIASGARFRADHALAGVSEASNLLDDTSALLGCLGAEGPAADSIKEETASTRRALSQGISDANSILEAARRTSNGVADFAGHYAHGLLVLQNVIRRYMRLGQEGYRSDDIEATLVEARLALGVADWSRAEEKAGLASQAIDRAQEERKNVCVPPSAAGAVPEAAPAIPIHGG